MPPPRPRLLLLVVVPLFVFLLALLLPRPAGAAGRERWRWPLRGDVVGAYRYAPARPFAAGARRGIDIAARPGATVRAACRGRVTFAGPLPGGGRGVTVRCGDLVATHLGLGRVAVRRGARVLAGARLGAVGAAGRLRLGARRRSSRFGYVDPRGLLGADRAPGGRAPEPLPLGRPPRPPRVAPPPVRSVPPRLVPHRAAPPAAAREPVTAGAPAGSGVPGVAWGGLVLVAAGLPLGSLVRRRRRRRRASVTAPAAVPGR